MIDVMGVLAVPLAEECSRNASGDSRETRRQGMNEGIDQSGTRGRLEALQFRVRRKSSFTGCAHIFFGKDGTKLSSPTPTRALRLAFLKRALMLADPRCLAKQRICRFKNWRCESCATPALASASLN
jgi:hypothetical protein